MKQLWMRVCLLLCAIPAFARIATPPPTLAVALLVHQSSVQIGGTKGFRATDAGGKPLGVQWGGTKISVTGSIPGVRYPGSGTAHPSVKIHAAGGGYVQVNGKPYRGWLELRHDGKGTIDVVNHVGMEQYLWGVVKAEMSATAPPAALRAQAVAARTFAMKNKDLYKARGYGLKATEQSQVYGGVSMEDARTTKAVNDTAGTVITFEGRLIEALYHAACGGHTENNEDVWGIAEPLPYGRARRCWGCQTNPLPPWSAEFDYATVRKKLMAFSWRVGDIERIEFTHSKTGRVKDVMVRSSTGIAKVPGNNFRLMIDRRAIKSLLVDGVGNGTEVAAAGDEDEDGEPDERPATGDDRAIRSIIAKYMMSDTTERVLKLSGRGSGHGVGLCQYGARQLAQAGKAYQEILRTYYSGIELRRAY
jgi:stage II sporulation protein D